MPKLEETKRNKNCIFWNHAKFNEMQKVMLRNVKIKEIPNFGPLKNSENISCYQKPLILLIKWRYWKNNFRKIICFGSWVISMDLILFIRFLFWGFAQAKFIIFFKNPPFFLHFKLYQKFLLTHVLFFLKNYSSFKKHGIAFME